MKRIEEARRGLIERGFTCLSGGKFGLPSYTDIEAWANGSLVIYFLFDRNTDGWDILASLDETNSIETTWANVDELVAMSKEAIRERLEASRLK